jgi:MFS transporter, DHA2 family, multidrug resistance protein
LGVDVLSRLQRHRADDLGWLGDVLGRKRYFLICIAMFTVFSLLCGTSTSLAELIVFRLAQGFFGGGMQPNQQSIILDTFPPEKRGAGIWACRIRTVVAPVLGPTLGGYITDNWNWRWIFFINIPTGLIAIFLISVLVEDPPWLRKKKIRGIHYIGLSLITVGLGCLQIMMDRGEDDDWFGSNLIRLMALWRSSAFSVRSDGCSSRKSPLSTSWSSRTGTFP